MLALQRRGTSTRLFCLWKPEGASSERPQLNSSHRGAYSPLRSSVVLGVCSHAVVFVNIQDLGR